MRGKAGCAIQSNQESTNRAVAPDPPERTLLMAIPDSMRAVQLTAYDGRPECIAIVEMPVPRPRPGEVAVRVLASPINPSDLVFIRGLFGFKKPLPAIPGFEGSGTVVEAGAGMMPRLLKGRGQGLPKRRERGSPTLPLSEAKESTECAWGLVLTLIAVA